MCCARVRCVCRPTSPFGGDDCSIIKASGVTTPKSKWIWLPVFSFLIEHPKGKILFDTGWHREMSPNCIASLATHDTDVEPHVIEL